MCSGTLKGAATQTFAVPHTAAIRYKSTPVFEPIQALVFAEIPNITKFEDIANLKKLKGYENADRIRLGDHRIGVVFDG